MASDDSINVLDVTDPCRYPLEFDPAACEYSSAEEDSLWMAMQPLTPTRKFITEHLQGPTEIIPRPLSRESIIWQFGFLLVAALILMYVRTVRRYFFRSIRNAFRSRVIFRQLVRDDLIFPFPVRFPLFLIIVITQSVLLIRLISEFSENYQITDPFHELDLLLTIIPLVSTLLLLKFFIHWILGELFDTRNLTREYLANSFYYNTLAGILLIPALMFYLFSRSMLLLGAIISILLIIILLRLYRGFIISMDLENYSHLQNLVYLCTLEILPLLIIYRLMIAGAEGLFSI